MKTLGLLLLLAICTPAADYYVTVAGLGGTPEYEQQFAKWAADLDHELRSNGNEAHVITLSGASATREHLEHTLAELTKQVQADDAFAIFLIGHGTFDGTDYKFNLPGPDITAGQLASLLNRILASRQLVVNTTSCSGASLAALARKVCAITITGAPQRRYNNTLRALASLPVTLLAA